jgi:nucleoside-diphosphate-sugar epimerase
MHILVTGASGFSGARIAQGLAAAGYRVTAMLGPSGRQPAGVVGVEFAAGDLCSGTGLPAAYDAVVHAAARSAWPGVSVDDMVRDNVLATRNLIAHALRAGAGTFVLFSSLSVHGTISVPVLDENTPIVDPDAYGLTKRLCEQMLEEVSANMRSLCVRLPGVLGPGSVRNWLTTSLAAAREGRDIRVSDPDAPFNNAVHVADLVVFIDGLLRRDWVGAEAVPLGAGGQARAGEVAGLLAQAGGRGARVVSGGPPRRGYLISSRRAREGYGYAPTEIAAMIRRFVAENA